MIVYILLFMFIFGLPLFFEYHKVRDGLWRNGYCLFIAFLFFMILFLKHDYVGTDTQNYRWGFNYVNSFGILPSTIDINSEIGFLYLQLFIGTVFGLSFRFQLLVVSAFYIYAFYKLIKHFSKIAWMSWYLFFVLGFFIFSTTMRQAIALSFTTLAFIAFLNKKNVRSIFLFIIAVSFHTSALVFFITYIITKFKWNETTKTLCFGGFIVSMLFSQEIINIIFELSKNSYESMSTGGWFLFFIYLSIVIIGTIYYKKIFKDKLMHNIFIMIVAILLLFPLAKYNPFFFRLLNYFSVYVIIVIPYLYSEINSSLVKLFILFSIMLYGLYMFYNISNSGVRLMPYMFFWQDYPLDKVRGLLPSGGW